MSGQLSSGAIRAVRLLYSLAFWAFLGISCVLMFLVGLGVFTVTFPFDRDRRAQHLFSCFWAQLYFYCNPFWRLRVEGRDRIPWRGAAVLVANHQSLGDILALFGLYRPFKWVSKASVFRIPFLGWNMRLNQYVSLVRGNKESIERMYQHCENWLKRGVPVLLFPEGTRSPDGEVKAFKDGAFQLATRVGCPLIPIVVTGTSRTLPKHGLLLELHANCTVRVLEAVQPFQFGPDIGSFREHVRSSIIAEKGRMERG